MSYHFRFSGHDYNRTRKNGSKSFTTQIVIKAGGKTVHREAQTFDRKQAANAWIVKREAELNRSGALEHQADPPLAAVIDRSIEESKNPVLGNKAQDHKAQRSRRDHAQRHPGDKKGNMGRPFHSQGPCWRRRSRQLRA